MNIKKFLASFLPNKKKYALLSVQSTANKKTQRDIDIENAIQIVKMYWTNDENVTEGMPGKKIDKTIIERREARLIDDCIKIIDSENPLMENRRFLVNSVISCAELQVLVLTKEADKSGLSNLYGISSELKEHIPTIVDKNKKLKEFFHSHTEELTFDYLWSNILHQYRWSFSDMNIFSALRILFNDTNTNREKDWFKPFFASMCIYSECQYREEIGLDNTLGEKHTNIMSLAYSTFFNMVLNGERYPDLAWREAYPKMQFPNF